jgi:predicted transcriptional regulator
MNLINISEKVTIQKNPLIKHLKLLQDSSLVIKENFGKNKVFFTITESGLAALRMFKPIFADNYPTYTISFKGMTIPG